MSDELTVGPAPAAGDQPETEARPKKRAYRRRKNSQPAEEPRPNGTAPGNGVVYLTPEHLSKLWSAVTGGQVEISGDTSHIVITVTLDSFTKALPVLLEKL